MTTAPRRALGAAVVLLALALAPAAGAAPDTTITFETRPGILTTRYEAQGVVFERSGGPFGIPGHICAPEVRASDGARSGTRTLFTAICVSGEFTDGGSLLRFTSFRSRVSFWIKGTPEIPPGPPVGGVIDPGTPASRAILTAYDAAGAELARTEVDGTGSYDLVEVSTPAPTIAFVTLFADVGTGKVRVDDLRFDNPDIPPAPAIALRRTSIDVTAGGTGSARVDVVRFNGSTGPVSLAVDGLPAEITSGSFRPNPLTAATSTLRLASDGAALPASATATITATPSPSAGTAPVSAPLAVRIVPAFTVAMRPALAMAPCTTEDVPVSIVSRIPGAILLDVAVEGPLAAALQATVSPTILPDGATAHPVLHLRRTGAVAGSWTVRVTGVSPPYRSSVAELHVTHAAPQITRIWAGSRSNADPVLTERHLDRPATTFTIEGAGFCPQTTVQVGNPLATVRARRVSVGELRVTTPTDATTGPIAVRTGSGQLPASVDTGDRAYRVRTYRGRLGLPWVNVAGTGRLSWSEWEEAFGADNRWIRVDLCLVGCTVRIPSPGAIANFAAVRGKADSGLCYGMSLSSLRAFHGDLAASAFPLRPAAQRPFAATEPFDTRGPGDVGAADGPSPEILRAVRVAQVTQTGLREVSQKLDDLIRGTRFTAASLRSRLVGDLGRGDGDVILLSFTGPKGIADVHGHAVVPYAVVDAAGGGYDILVYNPNRPYDMAHWPGSATPLPTEQTGDGRRAARDASRIHVGADGHWRFDGLTDRSGAVTRWTGTVGRTLMLRRYREMHVPTRPITSLVDVAELLLRAGDSVLLLVFGDASAGATTRVAAPRAATPVRYVPFDDVGPDAHPGVLVPASSSATTSIDALGSGEFTATAYARGQLSQVVGTGLAPGAGAASLTTDRATGAATVAAPGGSGPTTLTTVAQLPDGAEHVAEVALPTLGAGDALDFDASGGTVTLTHAGSAVTVELRLASAARGALPGAFASVPVTVGAGERLVLRPASWRRLGGAVAVQRIAPGGVKTPLSLPPRTLARARVAAVSLGIRTVGGRRVVTASPTVRGAAADGTVTVALAVRRGRRVVATRSLTVELGHPARLVWRLPRLARGTYVVQATAVALAGEGTARLASSTRRAIALRVR